MTEYQDALGHKIDKRQQTDPNDDCAVVVYISLLSPQDWSKLHTEKIQKKTFVVAEVW